MSASSGPGIPLVVPPYDPEDLASRFEAGFPLEFCACESFEPGLVAGLARAGFIPMAMAYGEDRDLLLPKLHLERCVLDPSRVRVTRTARRASRKYILSIDSAFKEVVAACVAIHGEDWLRPALVAAFLALHEAPPIIGLRLLSFELRDGEGRLVAGEFGALAGSCYTSWSGFRLVDGAGSVQLAALGGALARSGIDLWDLGMPLAYKLDLGAECLSRCEFLSRFRGSRALTPSPGLGLLPMPASELIATTTKKG